VLLKLTIPANTKETAPARAAYNLGRGLVSQCRVIIPAGHGFLTHLEIMSQGRPLYMRGERYVTGNDNEILFDEEKTLDGPPYDLTLSGWNEDDTFPHTFYVEVQ